ncbi:MULTISPECIES: amino acid ABC transporter ATP-binding protein [Leuconostoc]|uniref:Amino acid ABC transporter ATP-binding protein n=2 Tax=Leuconostoc kimchii TaxID=136609 RepID=A0ABX5SP33_9LACO|nr:MULTISPECIES: amino acid ABC transporter ATP-binding protein [Leuconostoc]ADG40800.1 putative amino acid ABC transporter, ATP-binding protein [Leuconostoc kimchii IMSNU 11154]AEJ31224.1 putative amino acid ABC transporter, ATP-binding protein [Leuconostoc sp. C2]QBR48311.1 amino acid ABC transporter ATP-binding protein [Leuconostoc kimchii]
MLKVKNFRKKYQQHEVLKGIDIEVEKGDVVALLGPSGSGKTTFLRGLAFLTPGDSGHIEFDNQKINIQTATPEEIKKLRQKMGFVFQNFNLFANKTAIENVEEGLVIGRHIPKAQAKQKAQEALKKVGLLDFSNHYPSQLSGGQAQRVGIARAAALDPEIILLDEPTSALDPELVADVLQVIKQLADEGKTMIVVTHEMAFARDVADKVIFMDKGLVVEQNKPVEFFDNPKSPRLKEFLSRISAATIANNGFEYEKATVAHSNDL